MTKSEIINMIIAVLALLASVWSVISTSRSGKRQNVLQERLLSLESARARDRLGKSRSASLRAWIERPTDYSLADYKLVIANDGSSEARSIRTLLDDQPILSHDLIPRGLGEITKLGAGASASYLLAVAGGVNPILSVSLSWEDDSKKTGHWSSQLNLF